MSEEVKTPPAEAKPAPPAVETPKVEAKTEPKATTLMGGDGKVSDGATPPKEEAKKAETPAAQKVVPEKYVLKLPEGSALDSARLEKISLYAKEKGLSNDEAQAVLERESDAVAEFAKGQTANYETTKAKWLEECKSDKDFGGEKLKESVLLANSVIKTYGSQALKDNLEATGLGNHPELLRMMVRIGREMAPDKVVQPGGEGPGKKSSMLERLYPNHPKGDSVTGSN